jgi:dTDP-4-dehydrorhamnose reductase
MNKVVVLGDGILGSELVEQTGWDYFSRKKDGIDISSFNKWMIKLSPYDVIVNCIAHTDTYSSDRKTHWKVNYEFVDTLVTFCNETNKKLIHISTDHIYANSKSLSSENDIPVHMETWYGYTKLLGDAHVQLKSNNYLIIRESHKPYPFPYKKAWSNQYTNGDYVNIIADLIIKLINKNLQGIYNVGTSVKTWFSLTKKEFKTTPTSSPLETPLDITMNLSKMNDDLKNINK